MNAEAFRQYYGYHFGMNRYVWNNFVVPLSNEQFTQEAAYSHGSVRDHFAHLINVDQGWFCELQGIIPSEPPAGTFDTRESMRAYWDGIEQDMREYLATLQDDMLLSKPITEPEEDKDFTLWQVLLHVANHGTDHRAQILRTLNDLGVETTSQDYAFYLYATQQS